MNDESEKLQGKNIETSGNSSPVLDNVHTNGGNITFHYNQLSDQRESIIDIDQSNESISLVWESQLPDINEYVSILQEKNIIFIHGYFSNIKQLSKLCANNIVDKLKIDGSKKNIRVREILIWENNRKLTSFIESECENGGAFIISDVSPENFIYCIDDIEQLKISDCYFIVITQVPMLTWVSVVKDIESFWMSPIELNLFTQDQRKKIISSLIEKEKLRSNKFSNMSLPDEDEWLLATEKLDSVNKINELLGGVAQNCEGKTIDFKLVLDRSQKLLETGWRFRCSAWFYQLSERYQLLALGLSIFNNIFSEQSFFILDRLVKMVWENRSVNLVCYDYKDIENISRYFRVVDAGSMNERIEPTAVGVSEHILNICWNSHRRYIVTALPEVLKLLRGSVRNDASLNTELYQNYTYREQLRRSISVFLGVIGVHNLTILEKELMLLLPEKNSGVQDVVSAALTKVYFFGKQDEVLKLLYEWKNKPDKKYHLSHIVSAYDSKNELAPAIYFQMSILLTISRISIYYEANSISRNVIALFSDVLNYSGEGSVHLVLENRVLPTLLYYHFSQFREDIIDFICKYRLTDRLPETLASVFSSEPENIWELLDSWFKESEQATDCRSNKFTIRLRILCVAVKTLGYIKYEKYERYITVTKAYEIIHSILQREHQSTIRSAALEAIIDLAHKHMEIVDTQFQDIIASLTVSERDQVIRHLSKIYINQRLKRNDGERIFVIDDERYHVWISQKRPKMEIEETMERWMEKVSNTFATQLAYLAESSFIVNFDKKEDEIIREYKAQLLDNQYQPKVEVLDDSVELSKPGDRLTIYSRWIAMPLGCYGQTGTVKVMKAILPVAIDQTLQEQSDMIRRFNDDDRGPLARSLKRVLYIEKNKNKFIFIIMCVAFSVYMAGYLLLK